MINSNNNQCSCKYSQTQINNFVKKITVPKDPINDCWIWTGCKYRNGYGHYSYRDDGKILDRKAHRMAYELWRGDIPEGKLIRHKVCDNPSCCNPLHLEYGSHNDNKRDSVLKNRHAKNETNGMAKLTWAIVSSIRLEYASTNISQRALAKKHNISNQNISSILNYRTWKTHGSHINEETSKGGTTN